MTPLDEFMAKKANDYMAVVDTWRPQTRQFKYVYDEYKRWVGSPNGTEWTGRTSNAAYDTASTDCHGSDNTDDAAEDGGKLVAATIQYEVVEPLVNGQRLIESVLEHKDQGVSIDQQYNMAYHPAEGESDDSIAKNREHVADIERQVKGYVTQWDKGCQTLKAQADAIAQKITGCINPKTALVDGRKILRDAATPKPGDSSAQPANSYKDWYPKATDPASIDPGAGTLGDKLEHINNPGLTKPVAAPVDPNAPVYGPPSAQKLDPNSPEGKAAIDKMRVILSPGRTPAEVEDIINRAKNFDPNKQLPPPKAPEGNPTPHRQSGGEAFAESWDQAGRAKDDLLGINGGDHAKEAWKGLAKGLWDVVNPDPVHQVERGIDQAKGAVDEVKSGIDNPKAFIGKHGIEIAAGIATAPVGGEGALLGTEGRALTHGIEDAAPGHPPAPHTAEPHTPVTGHAPTEPPSGPTHPAPVTDHPAPAADHNGGGNHGIPSNIEHAAGLPRSADDILNDSRAAHRFERDQLDWDRGEQNLQDIATHRGVHVDDLPRTPVYDVDHPAYTDKHAGDHSAEIDRHTQLWEHGLNTQSVQQVLDNMEATRPPSSDLRSDLRTELGVRGTQDLIDAGYSPMEADRLANNYASEQFPEGPGLIPQPVIHNPDIKFGGYRDGLTYGDWQVNNALGNLTKQERDAFKAWLETQDPNAIVNTRFGKR
ncbi:hypothetical protein [Mycobacteroides abscessus]|nr:hypothetical protein [Mycobacteroides abscessus]